VLDGMLKLRAQLPEPEAPAFMNAAVELIGTETKTRRYALTYVDSLGVIERHRFVEIAQRAGRWADLLRRQGLEPGGRVVVLTERDRHWRTALVGVLEAGGVAVPCAASAPVAEICSLAAGTGAAGVASTFPRPDLAEAGVPVLCVDHLDSRQGRRANRFARTRPDDFALILHEHDGSRFHGAAYTHDALLEQASTRAQQLGVGEGQRLWCTAPEASVPSLWLALAAWHRGVELVTVEEELEPQTKLGLLDKIRPAALWLSDEEYGELAAAETPWWADLGSIRHAITTGEPGEGALAFQEAFGVTAAAAPVLMKTLVIDASAPVQHAAPQLPTLTEPAPLNGAAEAANRLPPLLRRQEEAIILPRHELTAVEARRRAPEATARDEGRRRAEEVKRQDEERRREEQEARLREAQEARRCEEQEARQRRKDAKRRLEEEAAQRKLANSLDALLIGLDEQAAPDATHAEERGRAEEGKAAAEQRQRAEQAARAEKRRRAEEAEEARRRVAQQAMERDNEEKRRLEEETKKRKLAEKAAREAAQAEERRRAEEKKARERAEKAAAEERRRAEEAARADERRRAEEAKRQEEERLRREKETQRREMQQAKEREREKRRLEEDAKNRERAARAALEQRRRAEKAELIRRAAALVEARRRVEADRVRAGRRRNGGRDQGEELAPDVLSRISQYSAATPEVEQDGRLAANGANTPAKLPKPDAPAR
jgi:hypothetical protein